MFQFVGKLNYRQSYDKENDSKLKKKEKKKRKENKFNPNSQENKN